MHSDSRNSDFYHNARLKNETCTSQEPRQALQARGGSTINGYFFKELRRNCCECGSLQETLQVPALLVMQQRPDAICHCSLQPRLLIHSLPQPGTQTASHRCLVHQPSFGWMFQSQSCGESHSSNCSETTGCRGLKKLFLTTFNTRRECGSFRELHGRIAVGNEREHSENLLFHISYVPLGGRSRSTQFKYNSFLFVFM